MLIVVSPAKSLDFDSTVENIPYTTPRFISDSRKLVNALKSYSPEDISELMGISSALGKLNQERFANWKTPFTLKNAKQAMFAFTGEVYLGLQPETFSKADINFAQKHLRILSGLYGVLRPLDLMQPYRLEMGRKFNVDGKASLYEFWGESITKSLNTDLEDQNTKLPFILNLASTEYFNSVKRKSLKADVISPVFQDYKNGQYKIISFYAKKARGEMAAYVIKNKVKAPSKLATFDSSGYKYCAEISTTNKPIFRRKVQL
ncbi:peroxide stress protein YaaA [OM182 bacterium]|nr:peroxide stress protein YaaA [OM182 bacterium]